MLLLKIKSLYYTSFLVVNAGEEARSCIEEKRTRVDSNHQGFVRVLFGIAKETIMPPPSSSNGQLVHLPSKKQRAKPNQIHPNTLAGKNHKHTRCTLPVLFFHCYGRTATVDDVRQGNCFTLEMVVAFLGEEAAREKPRKVKMLRRKTDGDKKR